MHNSFLFKSTFAALVIFGAYSFAANRSFVGIVTDDMCARKHTMMPGKPDSECVRACVKAGSKHALLVGDKLYKLDGRTDEVDKFAGQRVTITGGLTGETIQAVSVALVK